MRAARPAGSDRSSGITSSRGGLLNARPSRRRWPDRRRTGGLLWGAVAVAAAILLAPASASAEITEIKPASLEMGQHAFAKTGPVRPFLMPLEYEVRPHSRRKEGDDVDWCTKALDDGGRHDPDKDLDDEAPCIEWPIEVVEPAIEGAGRAWRFRVAWDTPHHFAHIEMELYRPDGKRAMHDRDGSAFDSMEMTVYADESVVSLSSVRQAIGGMPSKTETAPTLGGTWVLRLIPIDVRDHRGSAVTDDDHSVPEIELRAKVEAVPKPADKLLAPNLRPEMPAYLAFGCLNLPPDTPTIPPPSRCLTFPFGYSNTGQGPLELDFDTRNPDTSDPDAIRYPVEQVIFRGPDRTATYTDNPEGSRTPAGHATYHELHGHFHYDNVIHAELLRVVDVDTGDLELEAAAAKRGSCAHDGVLAGFRQFADVQKQADSARACSAATPLNDLRIGLSAGWGDIYDHDVSDNYVAFPTGQEGDGDWVLRIRIDYVESEPAGDGLIRETDETDNVGYTWFAVQGNKVTLKERGRGTDPWDDNKVMVYGYGE